MMRNLPLCLACGLLFSACATTSNWEKRFAPEEKQTVLYKRTVALMEKAQANYSDSLLQKVRSDFQFLIQTYGDTASKSRLTDIDKFYFESRNSLATSLREAREKNNLLTAAGYSRRLITISPNDVEAKRFLLENEIEVKHRADSLFQQATLALGNKQYTTAQKNFGRVIDAYPDMQEALAGYDEATKKLEETRRAAAESRRRASEAESRKVQSNEERAAFYNEGKVLFDKKDFLGAYDAFSKIQDVEYKDTELYLKRTQEKIKALKLKK